jgi:hypothetical protein
MATKASRPGKNSDGQAKQPSYTHTIHVDPAKPPAPAAPPPLIPPPGAPAPGTSNPLTHPAHPSMQSSLGAPTDPNAPQKTSAVFPEQGNANPTGNPLGQLTPQPSQDMRQVREQIQFKDMSPPEQAQTASQQGLDPYAPLKMVQQGVVGALGAGPSTGPVPNMLAGPYVPPGIESFPDDFAHLSTLMKQGYAPGASPQEHEFGQNANAMARAKIDQAFSQAHQGGVGAENAQPYAPQQAQGAPPVDSQNVGFAPGIPEQSGAPSVAGAPSAAGFAGPGAGNAPPPGAPPAGPPPMGPPPPGPGGVPAPQLGSAMQSPGGPSPLGAQPPMPGAPPGPGGIPPSLIAALLAQGKGKRAGALR